MTTPRTLTDLTAELLDVMKTADPAELSDIQVPILEMCSDVLSSAEDKLTRVQEVVIAGIERVADPPTRDALAELFSGENRWTPLAQRGGLAAGHLGVSYDAIRRRGKDGRRRLDDLAGELATAIASGLDVDDLLPSAAQGSKTLDLAREAAREIAVFFSYSRADDEHEGGLITKLRDALASEFRFQTGQELLIFQDRTSIEVGENWRRKIEESLDSTTLLLVLLTPSYLSSTSCREELQRFVDRESRLGRDDLVIPIYYAPLPPTLERDAVAEVVLSHQYVDWRPLRFAPFESREVRVAVADLAGAIAASLARSASSETLKRPMADDSEPGVYERLAEMELALPRLVRDIGNLAAEQEGVTEEVGLATEETERLNRMGRGAAARLIVARRLATRLEPYAERMDACAAEFREDLRIVGRGIRAMADAIPSSDEEGAEETTQAFIDSLVFLRTTNIETKATIDSMLATYADVARSSSTLRPVLNRLSGAARVLTESPEEFERWIALLEGALAAKNGE